jgi:hypothetical protein
MKFLFALLICFISASCLAQEKAQASATQTLKIRLVPLSIVEKTTSFDSAVSTGQSMAVNIQSGQRWTVKTKKITANEKNFFRQEEADFMTGAETLETNTALVLTLSPL